MTIEAVACDVADRASVAALVERFGKDLPPLAGIIHGAMVLRDGPLRGMSENDIRTVLAPKLDGAVHLDELTRDMDLDFFVCHASISSLAGNRDQANYAAANAALEELMASRRASGRAGLAIGWGMLGEIGVAARERDIMDVFIRQGIFPLSPDKAWTAMATGIGRKLPYLSAIVVDWRQLGKFARAVSSTPRFALLAGGGTRTGSASTEAEGGETGAVGADIAGLVVHDIAGVLGMAPEAVDTAKPLPELGFDSLMAVELSVALEHSTGHGFKPHVAFAARPDRRRTDRGDRGRTRRRCAGKRCQRARRRPGGRTGRARHRRHERCGSGRDAARTLGGRMKD